LLTSSTIGAPLAPIWAALPPYSGLAAFCGAAAVPRPPGGEAVVCAGAGVTARRTKLMEPARPTSGRERMMTSTSVSRLGYR
jgi:hypothetical protein